MIKKVFGVVAGGGVLGLVGGEGIDCLRMFDFALLYLVGVNAVDVVDAVIDGVVESLHSQKPEMLDTTRRTRKGTHDESLRKDIFCVQGSADDGGSRRVFLCDRIMHLTSYRGLGGTASSQSQDIFEMEPNLFSTLPSFAKQHALFHSKPHPSSSRPSSSSLCHQTNSSFWALTTRDNG